MLAPGNCNGTPFTDTETPGGLPRRMRLAPFAVNEADDCALSVVIHVYGPDADRSTPIQQRLFAEKRMT